MHQPGVEKGAATAEMTVAFPLVLLLILLVAQFGIWQHAVHVAEVTAAEALASARAYGAGAGAGQTKGTLVLSQLGHSVLRGARVSVSRTADAVRVEVSGVAQTVVPFLKLPVRSTAYGPVEKFRGAGDRR
ncbi:TadE/TadG family type IV pilus assembly protein [Streptosporangium algeriense]|uniref:TadE/TadG family type IV pilus assembly protein n=1 Tax=Streptosporangium algeriense TaxID=1682748 RepID=A0ABW3DK88_9ACTN